MVNKHFFSANKRKVINTSRLMVSFLLFLYVYIDVFLVTKVNSHKDNTAHYRYRQQKRTNYRSIILCNNIRSKNYDV